MNILVTGANGQLGMELRRLSDSSDDHYIFSDISISPDCETLSLDITVPGAVDIICKSEKIDVIINCAAYTSVDKAENDILMADMLNHIAVKYIADAAKKNNCFLFHISTDYVFSGENFKPYKENDIAEPIGVYGITKLAGENSIVSSGCRYIIFRTAWMYSAYGHNFLKTILKLTSEKDSINVVSDQVGTPTYAADMALTIIGLIQRRCFSPVGIYHYSGEGVASWYDFAIAINEMAGHSCKIMPCKSDKFPSVAKRPHYSVLDKTLVKTVLGVEIPYWRSSLKDCLHVIGNMLPECGV